MSEYGKKVEDKTKTYMNNPDSVDKEVSDIQHALEGVEVRGALAAGVKKSFDKSKDAEETAGEAHDVMESIINEGFDNAALESNFEQKLDDKIGELQPEWTDFKNQTNVQLAEKANKIETMTRTEFDDWVATLLDGGPSIFYDTLSELESKYPNGAEGVALVRETDPARIYVWNGTEWADYGDYQGLEIKDDSLTSKKYKNNSVTPEKMTIMEKTRNLFNGDFAKGRLTYRSGTDSLHYAIESVGGTLAIVPLIPNQKYSVKIHDPEPVQIFYMGIIDEEPTFGGSYQEVDSLNYMGKGDTEHTFTNTTIGKYLLVYVSKENNDDVKLQVEVGGIATNYISSHVIDEKYLDLDVEPDVIVHENTKKKPKESIIIGCQEDETAIATRSDLTYDYTNYLFGSRGYKISVPDITLAGEDVELDIDYSEDPLKLEGASAIGIYVFIEDPSAIRRIRLSLFSDSEKTNEWDSDFHFSPDFDVNGYKKGWNHFRLSSAFKSFNLNNLTDWGTISHVRIHLAFNKKGSITIGKLVAEISDKAKILFVEDSQYSTFYERGYPDLKERDIPVTWALRIKSIGGNIGDPRGEQMTYEEVMQVAAENNNSMSFHSWGDPKKPTADMTAEELRIETIKCIKWLSSRGFNGWNWRAAIFQNQAPEREHIRDLVKSYSTGGYTNNHGVGVTQRQFANFPFLNKWDTPRIAITPGASTGNKEKISELFSALKKTKQVFIVYTHGISELSDSDTPPELWNHFISEIDAGINEGWLEGTTFEMLNEEYDDHYGIYTED